MADTNTTVLDLLLMEIDSHENDWGDQTNSNLSIIARAIGATVSHAVTTGTTTLTRDNVKDAIHRVTGALVGNVVIEVPALEPKSYVWKNETSGAFTVTIKVTGQTGVVLPQGDTRLLRCNGTDVVDVGLASSNAVGGLANWVGTFSFAADAYSSAANSFLGSTLYDGLTVTGFFDDANATASPTYNYASTGAKAIVHADGVAPAIGDIVDGMVASMTYKTSTDKWSLSTPAASKVARLTASNTFAADKDQTVNGRLLGALETLTDAATIAWDMADRPNDVKIALSASRTLGAPTNLVTGQQGTITVIQDGTGGWTLTPNALFKQAGGQSTLDLDLTANARTIFEYRVIEDSAATKQVLIKRMWSEGKTSLGYYKEYNVGTYVQDTMRTQAHSLGRYPAFVQVWLQPTTAEFGFATTDRIDFLSIADGDTHSRQPSIFIDSTNIRVRIGSNNGQLQRLNTFDTIGIPSLATPPNILVRVFE